MTTLTAHRVVSPGWVDIFATGLPAGTASVRIARTWAGATEHLSGAMRRPVLDGTWRYLDHSLPCALADAGIVVTYRVEPLTSGGAVLTDGVASIEVEPLTVTHSEVLLSDPLDPLGGVSVTVARPGDMQWSSSSGELLGPALGGLPVSTGLTRLREQAWTVKSTDRATAAKIQTMIERGGVLLVRGDPSCLDHPTGVVHLHVPAPTRATARGSHEPTRRWVINGTECVAPSRLALVATRPYADTSAAFASYAATTAALPTYLDRSRGEAV